ncbi:Methylglutaconyl-CoA hydratase [Candidatus Rhodobacter oscarellae]|uniref:Methylglutaconyl-CoA hydratase n=1 Tax=Candidatus Rhodobacter oscarellae TaxID=1675527 RepID=A0A0J9E1E8_9RHOB|nr:crotonase/enoyl-CoA hydratase family protein [Candidatus Rhodobacter lobularis]KMW56512.1 Methylglutaconyl-CoA hydratase [Candidatus Rhodobacter lobularis]
MSYEMISVTADARGVATLTLDRPEKHNALSGAMCQEIQAAIAELGSDPAIRVVVLTGAGKSFCAGGDLDWMRAQMTATPAERGAEARKLADMLFAINTCPKPVVGRLQGQAFGGGVGMACVCDVAIGVADAKFGLTETRLGLIPATIGPYVLARLGEAMARRVFMSARIFAAEEAAALGILSKAVAPDDLDAAVEAEVAPYLDCAPGAVAAAKALARRLGPPIDDAVIDMSVAALISQWEGDEAPEGVAAFFEKRRPSWAK